MKEITEIKELQEIELNILKYVDQICREHNLTYFLAYGTLIGAVRHQGFIPWDDDIDILMPREDYKKFCEILHKAQGRYKILCCEYDKDYMYAFGKVIDSYTRLVEEEVTSYYEMGVFIDIFPYDGLKNDPEQHRMLLKTCSFLEKIRYMSTFPYEAMSHKIWWKNIIRIPFWVFLKVVNYRRIVKLLNHLIQKYTIEESSWIGCLAAQAIDKELVPKECVQTTIEMEFENEKFKVPVGYDQMLRKMYGDYMVLPPADKQVPHHVFKAWWVKEE